MKSLPISFLHGAMEAMLVLFTQIIWIPWEKDYNFQGERFCPVLGADGWIAAEYRFRDIPLNISLNLKPFVELTIPSFVKIMPGDLGISVSYVF